MHAAGAHPRLLGFGGRDGAAAADRILPRRSVGPEPTRASVRPDPTRTEASDEIQPAAASGGIQDPPGHGVARPHWAPTLLPVSNGVVVFRVRRDGVDAAVPWVPSC